MFKSVIERQRAGRLGTGMWMSLGAHAALFAAVLFISARPPEPPPEPEKDYVLTVHRGPNVAKGSPAPAQPKQANAPRPRPRNRDVAPRQVQPLPPEPAQPPEPDTTSTPTDTVADTGDGVPGGHPEGDPDSTVIGVPLVPGLTGGSGDGPTGTDVLPFGQGMTPPVMVGGPAIDYTPQARAAQVEGTMIAKCVITQEGQVRNCRLIKGLPHMDESVLESLEGRHYRPVMYQGRAVSVSYVFTVRLKMPR